MIIGTGTTRPYRLCLVRYVGNQDTKKSIVRTRENWFLASIAHFSFAMSTEKCMVFCKRHERKCATKTNIAVSSTGCPERLLYKD